MKTVEVAISDLKPFPGNPRTHDLEMIKDSLERNGQYRAIVVRENETEDIPAMTILAGHGTTEAASELGWEKVHAHVLECDDETARRILLMDNRANDKAGYDQPTLIALLKEMPTLDGTGWVARDLDHLVAKNVASTDPVKIVESFAVVVNVADEASQVELLQRLTGEGFKCRALL